MADNALVRTFKHYDTDGSGELDVIELQRALSLGNLNFGVSDVHQMILAFDTAGNRRLRLQEFLRLHDFLMTVQNSFLYFDAERRGSLKVRDVHEALCNAGFTLPEKVLASMITRHDLDNSGTLTLDEYIRMCLFLQSCVRTFTAFDTQRTGMIHMDFNQLVYLASHLS